MKRTTHATGRLDDKRFRLKKLSFLQHVPIPCLDCFFSFPISFHMSVLLCDDCLADWLHLVEVLSWPKTLRCTLKCELLVITG